MNNIKHICVKYIYLGLYQYFALAITSVKQMIGMRACVSDDHVIKG